MMTPCQRSITEKRVQGWISASAKTNVLNKRPIPPALIQFQQIIDQMISKADWMIEIINESSPHEE